MTPLRVYVAAPYGRAAHVREVHAALRTRGWEPTSTWAERATGAENLSALSPEAIEGACQQNQHDIARADAVLALVSAAEGGEMFAEIERAFRLRTPVVWVGSRVTLSVAYMALKNRCAIVDTIDAGIAWLELQDANEERVRVSAWAKRR